jgi:hypothetical protein
MPSCSNSCCNNQRHVPARATRNRWKRPTDRRARVDTRAAELIAEEMTLRDLRRALDRT